MKREIAQTSVYLTDNDRRILDELMERSGLNRSMVIRLALQKFHQQGDADIARHARLLEIAEEIKQLA